MSPFHILEVRKEILVSQWTVSSKHTNTARQSWEDVTKGTMCGEHTAPHGHVPSSARADPHVGTHEGTHAGILKGWH